MPNRELANQILQSLYPLSEATIEAIVERRTDRLDRAHLAGEMTEAQYSKESAEIDAWAEQEYARR